MLSASLLFIVFFSWEKMHTRDDQKELWLKPEGRWLRTVNDVGKKVQRSTYCCQIKRLVPLAGNDLSIAKIAAASGPYCFSGNADLLLAMSFRTGLSPTFYFCRLSQNWVKVWKHAYFHLPCFSLRELLLGEVGRKTEIITAENMSLISLTPPPQLALVFIFCQMS